MYTAALHLLYLSFRWGSLGNSGLLYWVTVRRRFTIRLKRLKPRAPDFRAQNICE